MTTPLVSYEEFDLTKVVYKEPVRNSQGGMNGYLDTSTTVKRNPRMQLPLLRAPFGVSELNAQASEFSRRNLELSLDDDSPVIGFLKQWDDQTLAEAAANSKKWFGLETPRRTRPEKLFFSMGPAAGPRSAPLPRGLS